MGAATAKKKSYAREKETCRPWGQNQSAYVQVLYTWCTEIPWHRPGPGSDRGRNKVLGGTVPA